MPPRTEVSKYIPTLTKTSRVVAVSISPRDAIASALPMKPLSLPAYSYLFRSGIDRLLVRTRHLFREFLEKAFLSAREACRHLDPDPDELVSATYSS